MTLQLQLFSLTFSFFFGAFFSFLLKVNYRFIYNSSRLVQCFFTFGFVLLFTIIYFIGLEKINYGILHAYYFIMIILGVIAQHRIEKFIKK